MDAIDDEVIATLREDVFRPAVLERAIAIAFEEFAPKRWADSLDRLKAERRAVANECDRLANAIARGGPLEALVARLAERQARGEAIDRELVLAHIQPASCDLRALERRLREKVEAWRGLLRRNVGSGREVLRLVLDGPIKFTPVVEERRRGYAFEGRLALDRMLAGLVPLPLLVASPDGLETLCNVTREWWIPAA